MKLLITGREGQLGWELERVLQPLGEVRAMNRQGLDLTQPDSISAAVRSFQPEVIVNAAAYTAVDQAESEQTIAQAVNATAPAVLADEAIRLGALLIHYSTDYVFDGMKDSPYCEEDPAHPLSVYGQTKWQGEQAIRASGCRHFIFRTSWVYSPRGKNFMLTMLRLLREKPQISVVDDQIGAPTSTALLARATLQALGKAQVGSGTYHLTASGSTSWCGFARLIAEAGGLPGADIVPIASSAYPTAARRPLNSRLDCSRFVSNFGMQLPAWDSEARRIVAEVLAASRASTTGL